MRETATGLEGDTERAASYVLNRFAPARKRNPAQVSKARAEDAENIEELADLSGGDAASGAGTA